MRDGTEAGVVEKACGASMSEAEKSIRIQKIYSMKELIVAHINYLPENDANAIKKAISDELQVKKVRVRAAKA